METVITIRGVEPDLLERLQAEARHRGVDVSVVAREALSRGFEAAQVASGVDSREYDDLDHLAGTWSEADARAFSAATEGFRDVDAQLWK